MEKRFELLKVESGLSQTQKKLLEIIRNTVQGKIISISRNISEKFKELFLEIAVSTLYIVYCIFHYASSLTIEDGAMRLSKRSYSTF